MVPVWSLWVQIKAKGLFFCNQYSFCYKVSLVLHLSWFYVILETRIFHYRYLLFSALYSSVLNCYFARFWLYLLNGAFYQHLCNNLNILGNTAGRKNKWSNLQMYQFSCHTIVLFMPTKCHCAKHLGVTSLT